MAIITVSGGIYSGGNELAKDLSHKLGYRLVTQEHLLPPEASQLGAPEDEPEKMLSTQLALLEGPPLQRILYTAYMQVAICEDARTDNVVYHSQAAHLLLKDIPHHLGIRVLADMEDRIKAAMKYRFLNYERASELIRSIDTQRDKWVRALYNVDWKDPSTYDIVISATTVNIKDACEMVARTVETEIHTPDEAQQTLDDLVLAAELKVKLALEKSIDSNQIEISVHNGIVAISGTVQWAHDADRIREAVRQHPGVRDVESHTAVRF